MKEEKKEVKHEREEHRRHSPAARQNQPVIYRDVETLLEWTAPGRPHKKRSKEYYMNSLLIVIALEVILFLFSQYMLMMVILSIGFVSYALSVTPPDALAFRISTEGILAGDHFYLWQELYDFYFKRYNGVDTLHIRTKAYLPGELILMLGDVPKEQMKQILLSFLPYREVIHKSFTEKAGDWVVESFPLEKPQPLPSHHTEPHK